jgi:hypothetical protein
LSEIVERHSFRCGIIAGEAEALDFGFMHAGFEVDRRGCEYLSRIAGAEAIAQTAATRRCLRVLNTGGSLLNISRDIGRATDQVLKGLLQ